MFKPIKNFLTYIQKNASGSSIFGGNAAEGGGGGGEGGDVVEEKEMPPDDDQLSSHVELELKSVRKMNIVTVSTKMLKTSQHRRHYDEDDIETQIKSSIMLKKPLKAIKTITTTTTTTTATATKRNGNQILVSQQSQASSDSDSLMSHDHNRNRTLHVPVDELDDFRCDPPKTTYSSELEIAIDRTIAECKTETEFEKDEEPDEPFLDIEKYPNSEIIVIGEPEFNTSENSVDTIEDPLSIENVEEEEEFIAENVIATEKDNLLHSCTTPKSNENVLTTDKTVMWVNNEIADTKDMEDRRAMVKKEISKDLAPTEESSDANVTAEKEQVEQSEELRSDGSDSGLGSETTTLQTSLTSPTEKCPLGRDSDAQTNLATVNESAVVEADSSEPLKTNSSAAVEPAKPLRRSNLKRRLEVDDDVDGLESLSTGTGSGLTNNHNNAVSQQKKPKRSINFDNVQVYYFPRQQGFGCVPSAGGCTLGMGARHVASKTLTLAEHAAELRRAHRLQLQEVNPRGSSSDESEESEEDYLSEGSGSDLDAESNGFLQPVSPKQRRALLKAAGVRKIDATEKAECRDIRNSREVCGCTCRDFCDPETCACSQAGIKCQVDRDMFPCGCSRDACGNTVGRVEFNPARVRTHFIHTLMRLEMENRQQQNPYHVASMNALTVSASMANSQGSLCAANYYSQSNYSSGYASPAYTADHHQTTIANGYYQQSAGAAAAVLYGRLPLHQHQQQQQQQQQQQTPDMQQMSTSLGTQFQMESLEGGLFSGSGSTSVPSYGDLMHVPTYHNVSYESVQTEVPAYSVYQHAAGYPSANCGMSPPLATYSPCAVPSDAPFGSTSTTTMTGDYHNPSSLSTLESESRPSCNSANAHECREPDNAANFISLNTPLTCSSRLSQINDLLQHNRNATSALVAVSPTVCSGVSTSPSSSNYLTNTNATVSASLQTPPNETSPKNDLAYEELTPSLNATPPIVAAVEENGSPPKPPASPPTQPAATEEDAAPTTPPGTESTDN